MWNVECISMEEYRQSDTLMGGHDRYVSVMSYFSLFSNMVCFVPLTGLWRGMF